ncbi:hypothetical protein [Sinomicrobium weinanense]|uniref:Uncharacterized protein n=1 Tax=Sinomicrobium weinanense TaxID=2842200 RepID=A0A926Q3M5_9FLAO|nr:hypothetical protein [Sinomicrobium weinanense]MBC9797708.1 hypothetical protein [Sinomicrobium weinanense]MBU3122266.1 hypothetical protein [Sinomicrobium weinanense]
MDYLLLYKALHHILTTEEKISFNRWYASASPEDKAYFHDAEEDIRNYGFTLKDVEMSWERFILKLQG